MRNQLRESHPEPMFHLLNNGGYMAHDKEGTKVEVGVRYTIDPEPGANSRRSGYPVSEFAVVRPCRAALHFGSMLAGLAYGPGWMLETVRGGGTMYYVFGAGVSSPGKYAAYSRTCLALLPPERTCSITLAWLGRTLREETTKHAAAMEMGDRTHCHLLADWLCSSPETISTMPALAERRSLHDTGVPWCVKRFSGEVNYYSANASDDKWLETHLNITPKIVFLLLSDLSGVWSRVEDDRISWMRRRTNKLEKLLVQAIEYDAVAAVGEK